MFEIDVKQDMIKLPNKPQGLRQFINLHLYFHREVVYVGVVITTAAEVSHLTATTHPYLRNVTVIRVVVVFVEQDLLSVCTKVGL